jgi:hypothetical protein
MSSTRVKSFAGLVGGSAVVAAIAVSLVHPGVQSNVAGGSGDSATTNTYASPTIPAMSVDPTGMSMGSTVTAAPPATTMAVSVASASPTFKATAAAGCVNNGQCP